MNSNLLNQVGANIIIGNIAAMANRRKIKENVFNLKFLVMPEKVGQIYLFASKKIIVTVPVPEAERKKIIAEKIATNFFCNFEIIKFPKINSLLNNEATSRHAEILPLTDALRAGPNNLVFPKN